MINNGIFYHTNRFSEEIIYGIDCDKIILMQFTGLKDKSGKDIYEGDILATQNNDTKYDIWDEKEHGFRVVKWISNRFCGTPDKNKYRTVWGIRFVSIIGNVHENPELLEG